MIENKLRIGNFTSSEIYRLMSSGKTKWSMGAAAFTYIREKNMERRLGRSLGTEVSSRATSWGNLVEMAAFNLLGLDYKIASSETIRHPTIPFWSGSPDCETFGKDKTVVDIKCPMTLKSFCDLVDSKTISELRDNHKDGEKFFWQLVSNGILTGSNFAELVVYCPYQNELDAIRELASNFDGNQNKIAWIGFSEDGDLPYLIEGRHYNNINIIRFEIREEDKKALTERVLSAGSMLEEQKIEIVKYNPTEEYKKAAQDKIRLMKELSAKLKGLRYI